MEPLPYPPDPADVWPAGLQQAFIKINDIYHTAAEYLAADSYDTHRLHFYLGRLEREVYPLLLTLQDAIPDHLGDLLDWLLTTATLIAEVRNLLKDAIGENSVEEE